MHCQVNIWKKMRTSLCSSGNCISRAGFSPVWGFGNVLNWFRMSRKEIWLYSQSFQIVYPKFPECISNIIYVELRTLQASKHIKRRILLYGKITRLPMPEFCPHLARRRTHLHSGKRRFLLFWGWTLCLRPSFIYFSENPSNVTGNFIFPMQQTLQKVMKIHRFQLLREPFTYRDQAFRRFKIMQNDAKMHDKSLRN